MTMLSHPLHNPPPSVIHTFIVKMLQTTACFRSDVLKQNLPRFTLLSDKLFENIFDIAYHISMIPNANSNKIQWHI